MASPAISALHVYDFFWVCSMDDKDLCHGQNSYATCSRVSEVNYSMFENIEDHQYPSLIQSFFDTHCKNGVWLQDEARVQYKEMVRLRDLGSDTPTGVAYTEEEILALVIKGKQRGHIASKGRVVASLSMPPLPYTPPPPPGVYIGTQIDEKLAEAQKKIEEAEKKSVAAEKKSDAAAAEAKQVKAQLDLLMGFVRSNPQWHEFISQIPSQGEVGSGSGCGAGGSGAGGSGSGTGSESGDDEDRRSDDMDDDEGR